MTDLSGLLQRVESFSLDEKDAVLPFTSRLAREQGWSHAYAARVVMEYKRFMLLAVAAGHAVTPSEAVDQVWHLHLLYTRGYWQEFCGNVLGCEVHHGPTMGGSDETEKFTHWYEMTCQSYARIFAEPPPADIWPSPAERFRSLPRMRWVDLSKSWVIPRWFL